MTQMNLSVKQKQNREPREQPVGCQGEGEAGEGRAGSLGLADKLLHIRWINSKVLL